MTVPVQVPVSSSVANGVTTTFPYEFKIIDEADLTVTVDDVVITTGFTITGVGEDEGGDVIFDVAPANGLKVVRYLNPVLNRVIDYQQFGDWLADIVNGDFDRIWLALQFLSQSLVRTLQLPVDTTTQQTITQDAAERAGKLVGFDVNGDISLTVPTDFDLTTVTEFISYFLLTANESDAREAIGASGLDENKFTGLQTLANEVTIASATTIDLTDAGSNQFKLTGTVSVTGATMPQGSVIKGRAAAATPLVNSSTFKVQGGKNYTCNPGDWLEFTKDGDGIVYVAITKVNGKPVSFPGNETLVITNNASAPNNKLDIVADGISYSVDITVSGLGGLDTGSEASGTWYYIWLVYVASTSTISAVLSTSSTSPTVSGGYSYGVVIGAIYNDGSSNFIKYYQLGKEFWIGEVAVTTTVPPTSYTSLNLDTSVPPNAKSARISGQWSYGTSASAVNFYAPTSTDDLAQKDNISTGSGTAATIGRDHKIPLITAQTIYYKRTGTAAAAGTLYCNGGSY